MALVTRESVQSFFDYLKYEKRYSVHTISSYEDDLFGFIDYLSENADGISLKEISHLQIRSWLAALKETGLSARSINRKISTLKSFFKYSLKTGVIDATPMTKVISPKISRRLPSFVKEEDTEKLIRALDSSAGDWKSLNARALIAVFYATGMRLSELLNLREKQIDFGRRQVKVLGKGNKERVLPLADEIVALLKDYIRLKSENFKKTDDVLLVTEKGKKLYPKYAWLLVNTYLGLASTLDKKSPHVLRHTFATHLMNNGASLSAVKELLGHSSLAATQVYTHNTIEKLKDVYKKAHPKS